MIKLGIVMDSITSINIKKDSSFAMLLEAQSRGYQLYYMELSDLYMIDGEACARSRILCVEKNYRQWYSFTHEQNIFLSDLDIILMRKDPPFNMEYIYCTYMLERAEEKGTLVVNKPKSLRDYNEKFCATLFPGLTPKTLVTCSKEKLQSFWKENGDIILKPLDSMGGSSIFHIKENDPNFNVITEILTKGGNRHCIAQEYSSDVVNGDKRVFIIDGEPVPYCLARIPLNDETRSNLSAGGRGEARKLTESDWKISQRIGPILKAKGLIFVGIDIIGNHLIEINVTSPTCICEIEASFSVSISSILMDAIEKRLNKRFL